MVNLQENNIGLVTSKTLVSDFKHTFVSKYITNFNFLDTAGRFGSGYLFPLYILKNGVERTFFGVAEPEAYYKTENFTKDFRTFINAKYAKIYTPEQILGYIYAILHSPTYRSKYAEFLKIDFPRIPFAETAQVFEKLSGLGSDLVQKHLLNEVPTDKEYKTLGTYKGDGNNIVEKPVFSASPIGALYINKTQYFDNVPEAVYNFHIGGYQVLDKYLKDRKTCTLTIDEIENVENIVKVLAFTIKQMEQIDTLTIDWI
jgi:predicted helicase